MYRQRSKTIRNTVVSVIVLLVFAVGGGVAYTYFMGQSVDENTLAASPPPQVKAEPVVKPPKPAPNARVGAAATVLTSPVKPGSNASINVRTTAGATCKIVVTYGNVTSKDSGLAPKKADDYGSVTWTWTVEESAPVGKWPVHITCEYNGKSAVVQTDLQVASQE